MSEAWKSMRQVCAVCDIWAYQPLVNHVCAQPKSSGPRVWTVEDLGYDGLWLSPADDGPSFDKNTCPIRVVPSTPETAAAHEAIALLETIASKVPHKVSREEAADMACEFNLAAQELLARITKERG